jgi:adenine-specific DNA methylase
MIPKECKRLAEVDFPIAQVSKHSAREKSIRHGHPSTLHLWWARRPLAACRAMLMALLLPDPCDDHCPKEFIAEAATLLLNHYGRPMKWEELVATPQGIRKVLLDFIADFANWDNSSNSEYLKTGRALVKAAHPEEIPLVVDPFAGGGSIPLEALRLGCEAFASDLNPVACLILKVMLEDIPRHGPKLAEELRRVGKEIKEEAEKELSEFYPKDPDDATPIAYLWARTVRCESPNCGAEIPLVRSFWLCKKPIRKRALRYTVVRPIDKPPYAEFGIFEPKTDKEVPNGTITRAKATCLCCNTVLAPERVRAQLVQERGGADVIFDKYGNRIGGARMIAVVTLKPGQTGRFYRPVTEHDYQAVWKAQQKLNNVLEDWERGGMKGLSPVPDEPLPTARQRGSSGFRILLYGIRTFGDLFTSRQKVALHSLATAISSLGQSPRVIVDLLALMLNHTTERCSSLCRWRPQPYMETIEGVFGRQALPMVWDFAESTVLSESTGSFLHGLGVKAQAVENAVSLPCGGQVELADAGLSPLPDSSVAVWFTDPPYYDAIAYADLSDFFFVWFKRTLPGHPLLRDPFNRMNTLTPKDAEVIQDPARVVNGSPKNKDFYENAMARAFAEGRRVLKHDAVGVVVFAHKTTEGWEALLSGMILGGWTITGSWPIATEMGSRLRALDTASLATSVHLVCRPRPDDAPIGDWAEVLRELPNRVGGWMERLQSEGIRGADLVFACIGPALEIFSRFRSVETADGREVKLAEYLEKVWEVVGRTALEQVLGTEEARARNGMAGALEEDARLTALFLWTLQSTNGGSAAPNNGTDQMEAEDLNDDVDNDDETTPAPTAKGYSLIYDVVRRFAQPLGIDLRKWEGRIIETNKGIVRLLPLSERIVQLLEPRVAEDLGLLRLKRKKQKEQQMDLFEREQKVDQDASTEAAKRVEEETWSHLHRDSITTLDHVHKAMMFQKQGQTNALRELLFYEQQWRPDFLRLANSLSALYPKGSEEKRLLDAMLLAVPR